MTNRLLFPEKYLFKIPVYDSGIDLKEELCTEYFALKDDPYHGLDSTVTRKVKSKYLFYQEKENIFLYYSRAFLEGEYSGKPFFPYFKGSVEKLEGSLIIQGHVKYNKVLSFFLPLLLLGMFVFILLTDLPWFLIGIPILLALIIKVSSKNLKKELIKDFQKKVETLALKATQ